MRSGSEATASQQTMEMAELRNELQCVTAQLSAAVADADLHKETIARITARSKERCAAAAVRHDSLLTRRRQRGGARAGRGEHSRAA
jgi:hypothetical protein